MPAVLNFAAALVLVASEAVAREKPQAEQRASVLADLTVAPDGKVVGCEVLQSSGYPALDSQACATLSAKAAFKPIKGRYLRVMSQRMTFVLTDEPAPTQAPAQ